MENKVYVYIGLHDAPEVQGCIICHLEPHRCLSELAILFAALKPRYVSMEIQEDYWSNRWYFGIAYAGDNL